MFRKKESGRGNVGAAHHSLLELHNHNPYLVHLKTVVHPATRFFTNGTMHEANNCYRPNVQQRPAVAGTPGQRRAKAGQVNRTANIKLIRNDWTLFLPQGKGL